jgi:hypothetical protein
MRRVSFAIEPNFEILPTYAPVSFAIEPSFGILPTTYALCPLQLSLTLGFCQQLIKSLLLLS